MSGIKTEKSLIILGVALLAISGCSKKGDVSGLKATVEIVDGVRTVRNPEVPRYGEFAFDLIEDLVIGDEKKDDYFLPGWVTINADEAGTIYACDSRNRRVQVYDRSGAFVRTLGRQGQGPGEYRSASNVYFGEAGEIFVRSPRVLVVFGRDALFKRNVPLKTFLSMLILGPGGTIIGTTQPNGRAQGGPKNELVQLGPDGERLRTLAAFPVYGVNKDGILDHWYTGGICFCRRSSESVFYGFSQEYLVRIVDGEGRELLAFSKAEKAQGITGEEKDLTREKGIFAWDGREDPKTADLGMPDHRPFFSSFISDDMGRLYVVRFRSILEKDDPVRKVDVFSKDGFYLFRMTWAFMPQVIRGGFLYEVRQDEEAGITKIVRHKITNWTDFKAE